MPAPPPPALGNAFSLYLDLTRFAAAVMVVLAHVEFFGLIAPHAWGLLPAMGREAVIVFFVLSGYVIAATVDGRQPSARDYALARLSRLYSVALPVLLLALAGAFAVRALAGRGAESGYVLDQLYLYLPFHLLFLGQHWTLSETPPLLLPYWSLCYEAWYYLLFGLAWYLRGRRRLLLVGLALAFMGYKMWLLLPVWLAGAWLQRAYRVPWMRPGVARVGWLASLLLFAAWVGFGVEEALRAAGGAWWPFPALPLGSADRYLADWVLALLVLVNFACARDACFGALARIARPLRLLAGHTFTLYLSHSVVIGLWLAFYPHRRGAPGDLLLLGATIAATTFVLGALTEGRRDLYRAAFARLLAPGGSARPPTPAGGPGA